MESREVLLRATDVHVTYRTHLDARLGLRHRLRQGLRSQGPRYRNVEAVRGVDLELYRGQAVGLVGSNGSGKSSLLTGLAGLIELERGLVEAVSRPSLLGVGAALNPRLSGRRNIEIGCMALGLSKVDVDDRMDEIVEFTGLGGSIDLPMNTYSSGMRARLVFTIATELEPEILFIDEALAVRRPDIPAAGNGPDPGDGRGSLGHRRGVAQPVGDRPHVHSASSWLDQGQMVMDGEDRRGPRRLQGSVPRRRTSGTPRRPCASSAGSSEARTSVAPGDERPTTPTTDTDIDEPSAMPVDPLP